MASRMCVVFCFLMACGVRGQDVPRPTPTKTDEVTTLWHETKALLPTRVLLPSGFDAIRTYTLLVALHGYGSSAEAFVRFGRKFSAEGLIVAIPECPYPLMIEGNLGYDWTLYHEGDEVLSKQAAFLAVLSHIPTVVTDLRQRYRVDHVFVLGFSQGSILALGTGIYNNGLFDGIVTFGLPGFETSWFRGNTLSAGNSVRVLLVHGQQDQRAAFSISEHARDVLINLGYAVTLRPFEGGHSIPDEQIKFAVQWFKSGRSDTQ